LPNPAVETYTAHVTAVPAVQFNKVYLTPCSAVPPPSIAAASDKRCSLCIGFVTCEPRSHLPAGNALPLCRARGECGVLHALRPRAGLPPFPALAKNRAGRKHGVLPALQDALAARAVRCRTRGQPPPLLRAGRLARRASPRHAGLKPSALVACITCQWSGRPSAAAHLHVGRH